MSKASKIRHIWRTSIPYRVRMRGRNLWNHFPVRARNYDLTIDLAEIKTLSIKLKTTGTIKRKILRKWYRRDYSRTNTTFCKMAHTKCIWVPYDVFPHRSRNRAFPNSKHKHFHWICTRCHSVCAWTWDTEVSAPMLAAYKQHTKNMEELENDEQLPPWLTDAISSATPYDEDSISL